MDSKLTKIKSATAVQGNKSDHELQVLKDFKDKMLSEAEPVDPEIAQLIDDNLWDLV